jgi:hypothetical protein
MCVCYRSRLTGALAVSNPAGNPSAQRRRQLPKQNQFSYGFWCFSLFFFQFISDDEMHLLPPATPATFHISPAASHSLPPVTSQSLPPAWSQVLNPAIPQPLPPVTSRPLPYYIATTPSIACKEILEGSRCSTCLPLHLFYFIFFSPLFFVFFFLLLIHYTGWMLDEMLAFFETDLSFARHSIRGDRGTTGGRSFLLLLRRTRSIAHQSSAYAVRLLFIYLFFLPFSSRLLFPFFLPFLFLIFLNILSLTMVQCVGSSKQTEEEDETFALLAALEKEEEMKEGKEVRRRVRIGTSKLIYSLLYILFYFIFTYSAVLPNRKAPTKEQGRIDSCANDEEFRS